MLWALAIPTALAVDLTTLHPAWTVLEASDGDGDARAVFFEPTGEVTAAGWTTGVNDHDAYVLRIDLDGTPTPVRTDDAGEAGLDVASSDDRWYDALRDSDGRLVLCGQRGAAPPLATRWFVLTLASDDVTEAWSAPYDGGMASPEQACRGIERSTDRLHTAGWVYSNPTIAGQWHLWAMNPTTGLVTQQSLVDLSFDPYLPDIAHDVATYDDATTAVAGVRAGDDGRAVGRLEHRDGADVLWSFEHLDGDIAFERVAVDEASGRTVVVGSELATDGTSDGIGFAFNQTSALEEPPALWTIRWDEADDSGLTGVTVDDTGAFLVLGWVVDGGVERWRVVRYDNDDGSELDRWEGPAWAGDSRPRAAAFDGTHLALAGTIDEGDGPRFGVMLLGPDRDGDLTPDIVDGCPDDVGKTDPGVCGCDIADTDTDGDGVLGCEEACPSDPFKTDPGVCGCNMPDEDDDGDGTLDCNDDCSDDPGKTAPGTCGCGVPDSDDDGDGYLVCQDQCPDTAPGVEVDAVGCEIVETVDTAEPDDDTGAAEPKLDDSGCGCQAAGGSLILPLWALLPWALRRRRSVAAPAC